MRSKKILSILLGIVMLFSMTICSHADMGPKPEVTILVKNPPEGTYYLDLLVPFDSEYDNLGDTRASYDATMLAVLENYEEDGWYAALVHGTGIPMWGDLVGEADGAYMSHTFGYFGVPNDFKIIIVTQDGNVHISDEIHRTTYQSTITYDFETGAITQANIVGSYALQFVMTFVPTLLIEGVVLLLFRFSLRKNWLPLLVVNLITQIAMTAILGTAMFRGGLLNSYLLFVPVEIGILFFEMLIYAKFLKQHSLKRRICYALVANITSAIAGWFLLGFEFWVQANL